MPAPNPLRALLAEKLAEAERLSSLRRFIAATPGYTSPEHLGPYLDLLERSRREPIRAVVAAPPRHGKSESTLHYVVQSLLLDPRDRVGYATYAAEFSEQQAKRAAILGELHGLKLAEQRASFWRTPEGGEAIWTSIGGPLTGKGVRRLFVDDPVKGRAEAESAAYREAAWSWFNAVAYTRLEPGGSCIVMATRWHPDDLSGRLIAQGWSFINLRALSDAGEALWPERFPSESLGDIRTQIGEYEWASLYQGEPRAKGGRVFGDVHFYDRPPEGRYRVAVGVDLAYTSKKHSDYSVAVALAEKNGEYYLLEVQRAQTEAPRFFDSMLGMQSRYPGARFSWHASTTERGLADMMQAQGLNIAAELASATGDKFARAQPVAAAWNAGRILVPRTAGWADAFTSEVVAFTGVNDRHDDQVDALASAFAALDVIPIQPPRDRSNYRLAASRGFG